MHHYRNPKLVRQFTFTFAGVDPALVLRGSSYDYQAELVKTGNITIPPAVLSKEDVTIVDVTGMPMAEVIRWFDHPDEGYRLAKAGEVVEIAEVHQDIQRWGRFYAAGESWPAGKNTLFLFLDNESHGFVPGRASHIEMCTPSDHKCEPSLGNGLKAFVAVIGECPRLEQAT